MRAQTLILAAAFLGIAGPPQADATSMRPDASCPNLKGLWECKGAVDVFQVAPSDPDAAYRVSICQGRVKRKVHRFEMNCGNDKDTPAQKASIFVADGKTHKLWSVETPHTGGITIRSHASCLAGVLTATHDFYSSVDGAEALTMSSKRTFKTKRGPGRTRVLGVTEQELSPGESSMVVEVERKAVCKAVKAGAEGSP